MIIKKIALKNIRSYEDAEISIPEGSVLLSGDIGTGKTSVLLAIEFALFGLQPGQRGSSLLRNGKNDGNVILEMEIGGKAIVIERSLKKSKTISQEDVSITIDNEKKEMGIQELKNLILSILNYPPEFEKKTNLLYKFTVYTPQEEMKQIILEDATTRLDTLRHVFGIDKYKRIVENLDVVAKKLREEARNKEGIIKDLDLQKEKLENRKKDTEKLNKNIQETEKNLSDAISERKKAEQAIKDVEEKINEKNKYEQEIEKTKIMLMAKKEQSIKLQEEIDETEKEFRKANEKFDSKEFASMEKLIQEKKNIIENIEKEYIEIISRIKSLESKKAEQQEIEKRISAMKSCPTCLQDITEMYRSNVVIKIEQDLNEIKKLLQELSLKKSKSYDEIKNVKQEIQQLEKRKSELDILNAKIENLRERHKKIEDMQKQVNALKADIEMLEKHMNSLKNSVLELSKFERIFEIKGKELETARQKEKNIEINIAELKKEKEFLSREMQELSKEIVEKENIKKQLAYINELNDWLSNNFLSLMEFTERNIMIKLREEFSKIFNEWFSVLVSDMLIARLDENFTPVVEQQGYEIEYAYLSGGERTAVALAYRLALNQVINSLLSRIKTKDIVILDEPPDGFSEQQLDKMRDVLQQLKVKQLILVSHEQKIEGFVDNIIRFKKVNGVTRVEK